MTRDKRDRNNMTGRHHQSEMHAFMRDRHDSVWRGSTCRGGVGYRTTGNEQTPKPTSIVMVMSETINAMTDTTTDMPAAPKQSPTSCPSSRIIRSVLVRSTSYDYLLCHRDCVLTLLSQVRYYRHRCCRRRRRHHFFYLCLFRSL